MTRRSPDEITLTLPLPPNIANARMHWRAKNRRKIAYMAEANVWRMRRDNPVRWHGGTPGKVAISVKLYVWSIMDIDNLVARLKWPLDWLTMGEYIVDDSPDHLRWAGMPEQEIDRKNRRVEITLTRE